MDRQMEDMKTVHPHKHSLGGAGYNKKNFKMLY